MRPAACVLELMGAALLVLSFIAREAGAAELLLTEPSACELGEELPFRAERALGQPLATAAPVRCTIHVERDGALFSAEMELSTVGAEGSTGKRSFRAPSCELLADTLALAVALAIGEGEAASTSSITAPAVPAPVGLPFAPKEVPAPLAPEPDSGGSREEKASATSTPWFGGARAGLVADAGTLPGLALGAALEASLGIESIELRALGIYLPPHESTQSRAGASAEFALLAAGLAVCAPRALQTVSLRAGVCLGGELGELSARARGFTVSGRGAAAWKAARLDVDGRWALGHGIGVALVLSALAPFERDRFVIDERSSGFEPWSTQLTLHRAEPLVMRASIGLDIELGASD